MASSLTLKFELGDARPTPPPQKSAPMIDALKQTRGT